jgi:hypothetical protein
MLFRRTRRSGWLAQVLDLTQMIGGINAKGDFAVLDIDDRVNAVTDLHDVADTELDLDVLHRNAPLGS